MYGLLNGMRIVFRKTNYGKFKKKGRTAMAGGE